MGGGGTTIVLRPVTNAMGGGTPYVMLAGVRWIIDGCVLFNALCDITSLIKR